MAKKTTRQRVRRSVEDLQRASIIVQYEITILAQMHEMLQELNPHWGSNARDKALSNALLHSFLLAARNLLSFLYSHYPRENDIIAEDFFDTPDEWRNKRPVSDEALTNGELVGHISKRLAHLTWERATTQKPLWGPFRIAWTIGTVMQSFIQLAKAGSIHLVLREDADLIMARLEAMAKPWGGVAAGMAPSSAIIEFDDVTYFGNEGKNEGGS